MKILTLIAGLSMLSASALATPPLGPKVYPSADLAARSEAANQMTRALKIVDKGARPVHAGQIEAIFTGFSVGGKSSHFRVLNKNDIPGNYDVAVLKVKGGYRAYQAKPSKQQ
jgi:hypothetical protein